jgi:hypothetical protein
MHRFRGTRLHKVRESSIEILRAGLVERASFEIDVVERIQHRQRLTPKLLHDRTHAIEAQYCGYAKDSGECLEVRGSEYFLQKELESGLTKDGRMKRAGLQKSRSSRC